MEKPKYKYINLNSIEEVNAMIGQSCDCGNFIVKGKYPNTAYCGNHLGTEEDPRRVWALSRFAEGAGKIVNKDQLLFDEIKAINDRIDKLAKYLEEKFDSDKVVFYPKDNPKE